MIPTDSNKLAPIEDKARITELDALRGFALLGVLLGIISELIFFAFTATEAQLAALPTAEADGQTGFMIKLLVTNKFNTLFAFLFGVGFYLQLDRLKARGERYLLIYLRRLSILVVFGALNLFFISPMDILFVYGISGLFLLALHRLADKSLLIVGSVLALLIIPFIQVLTELTGFQELYDLKPFNTESAILARQALLDDWHYGETIAYFAPKTLTLWLLNSSFIGFIFYALGRFLIGMWVGRRGWLMNARRYLGGFSRFLWICLPLGLLLEYVFISLPDNIKETVLGTTLHMIGVPILAAGYLCMVVVGINSRLFSRFWALFAPVGKMALTNYIIGGAFAFGLFFGPFGLAGHIGMSEAAAYTIMFYIAQIPFSHFWLKYFKFGPLEWVWRSLTYMEMQKIKKSGNASESKAALEVSVK